ncbi:glycosyltransferase family 4 protein [Formosa sp. A9]|uniref:glycosyltransferase family 4 protein n=1 Tax=Formosa sp. A9 TaxID=3442641 RepID=UPI003EBDF363
MSKRLKIAILSGTIPSTTFIEHLINGVAETHDVYLFGVLHKKVSYTSKHIQVFDTPKSTLKNLWVTGCRSLKLAVQAPSDFTALISEVRRHSGLYNQWVWFTKFLPIVLHKPDVIHLQWARDVAFYTIFKIRFGIPMVLSLRGAHINYTPIVEPRMAAVYKKQFPNIDAFHAVSQAIGREAEQYGADAAKITTIHSPIPDFFFQHFKLPVLGTRSDLHLVSVGRFHWVKGYEYAIQTVAQLKAQGIKVRYTIVGPESFTEAIAFQIHQLDLVDQVHLVAALPQEALIDLLHRCHMMLLPSLKEGIANVVLEAMAIGLPVISTNCGGMAEVIKPGKTGWLVPVRNPEAMMQAVLEVLHTPESQLHSITQQAHDFVKREFYAKDSIQQFVSLYEAVVG